MGVSMVVRLSFYRRFSLQPLQKVIAITYHKDNRPLYWSQLFCIEVSYGVHPRTQQPTT